MSNGIQIQRSASLRDQVNDAIMHLLKTGDLVPGTRITEQGMAKRLDVSRTPIREALGRLAQQGVLELRDGGGYFVPLPSADEIREIISVRMLLEPPAVRMAAEQFSNKDHQALDDAIAGEIKYTSEKSPTNFAHANEAFRSAIFGAISNKALRTAIGQFEAHLHFIRAVTLQNIEVRKTIIEKQESIRAAIRQRDLDMAELMWRSYLRLTEETLIEALCGWEAPKPTKPKKK